MVGIDMTHTGDIRLVSKKFDVHSYTCRLSVRWSKNKRSIYVTSAPSAVNLVKRRWLTVVFNTYKRDSLTLGVCTVNKTKNIFQQIRTNRTFPVYVIVYESFK